MGIGGKTMIGGYMDRILFVDLSHGTTKEEHLDEELCRQFLGGYALGARLIWDWQRPGVHPLSPENILGFITGPLTGTPAFIGSRYMVVGKSPLTETWGDANSGGSFGPHMRFAGYDAVFFEGKSERPVYLLLRQGEAELRDAQELWGLDTAETEDFLKAELEAEAEVACIGPAGEKMALISCIVNNKGRVAGRSGLGAVMGSKKLKAIAVVGDMEVPLADKRRVAELRKHYLAKLTGPLVEYYRNYGTCGGLAGASFSGDAPVKNWKGAGPVDFPGAEAISDDNVIKYQEQRYACWRCPLGCGGHVKVDSESRTIEGHKPEYETLSSFGTMTLVDDVEAIIQANNLCNRYGLDSISAGATIAFAMECYEEGLLSPEDTDGLDLQWGNAPAMLALTEKLATREGLGDLLADGVQKAAGRIRGRAEDFAIHIKGQELPMHDPRYLPTIAISYWLDATPGRHTQGGHWAYELPSETRERLGIPRSEDRYSYTGKAEIYKKVTDIIHVVNAAGLCQFGYEVLDVQHVPDFLSAVTGWDLSLEECLIIGERIGNLRHLFNLREGFNPLNFHLPGRAIGKPPLKAGNVAGVEIDVQTLVSEYLAARNWDPITSTPRQEKLIELGLVELYKSLP
jgi:aldehyde:ferredoxin oxidoreductase